MEDLETITGQKLAFYKGIAKAMLDHAGGFERIMTVAKDAGLCPEAEAQIRAELQPTTKTEIPN